MTTAISTQQPAATQVRTLAVAVFLFGAGIVFMTGFAHPSVIHNGAHDTRHGLSLPCH